MKTVYKYSAKIGDTVKFFLPLEAEILHVDVQGRDDNGQIFLWALVDPAFKVFHEVTVRIAGTGHPIEGGNWRYINTFTMMQKTLWFHAFVLEEG